ncbi:MAG: hypothetical protein LIO85_08160 [Rikenellaceae bacterium]|nr:hypothetical protein [Rikenellaceae bacterium]
MDLSIFTTRCKELDKRIWALGNEQGYVAVDGVIDPKRYFGEPLKLLWICKEPNSQAEYNWRYQWCFHDEEWVRGVKYTTFYKRFIYTSWGILNGAGCGWYDFPDLSNPDHYPGLFDSLKRIAFINVKKELGESRSYDNEIRRHCAANMELLLSQIALADADVIIFGNTLRYFDRRDFAIPSDMEPYVSPVRNHYYPVGGKLYARRMASGIFRDSGGRLRNGYSPERPPLEGGRHSATGINRGVKQSETDACTRSTSA